MIVIELLKFLSPYLLKLIIDLIAAFDPSKLGHILLLVAGIFATNQFTSFVAYFANKKSIFTSVETEYLLKKDLQKKMVSLGLAYHEKENTGRKVSKIQRGVDRISSLLDNLFWDVTPTLIQVFLTTVILYLIDWRFGLMFTLFVPLFIYITIRLNKNIDPHRKQVDDYSEAASGKITQSILNINTVKSFAQEDRETKEYVPLIKGLRDTHLDMFRYIFRVNLGRDLIINIGEAGVILFGIYLLINGSITIGSLVFVITISQKSLTSLYRISRLYDKIMEASEAVSRIYTLHREQDTVVNPKNPVMLTNFSGKITFQDIAFRYNKDNPNALHNVNLIIPANSITAFVGPSGGGKTTLVKMIYRHYDPAKGSVLFDHINIKDMDLTTLRKLIGIVPQEVDLFDTTIRENICYANKDATQKEIENVAKLANANEFIEILPNGYETMVGERGIKLSGGQKQRIGIARALLADPRILIFDEATSNLDSKSERLIQDSLDKIGHERTTIIIAHRFSTIRKADKIVVLEDGKVVEEGNHSALASKTDGLYAQLLKLQKLGEVD